MTSNIADGDREPQDSDLAVRRRRAIWRATHRGTRELDILVGRYAGAFVPAMTAADLDHFEDFITVAETELQRWLLSSNAVADDKFAGLVTSMRRFHGLT